MVEPITQKQTSGRTTWFSALYPGRSPGNLLVMLLLAATTLEKLQQVPARFWWNVALAIGIFAAVILLARYAARMNKLVVTLIVFLLIAVVGVQWVYERNEPKFMSSTIDKIAPYLPKKVQYKEYTQPK